MTEAEIRAVTIEYARLQRGGRLGEKYIRDNKDAPATQRYGRRTLGSKVRKFVPELAGY
jgi:hypothetical protein